MSLNIARYDPLRKGFHTMKTSAYETAETGYTPCLLVATFTSVWPSNTEKKTQTINEVTVGNGSKSTYLSLIWVLIL